MIEKITQSELDARSMASVSTTPTRRTAFGESGMDQEALKLRFDRMSRLVAKKVNEIIDGLSNGQVASDIIIEHDGFKWSLAHFIQRLLSGDVDHIPISMPTGGKMYLTELALMTHEMYFGLSSGDLADKLMLNAEETLADFYARSLIHLSREIEVVEGEGSYDFVIKDNTGEEKRVTIRDGVDGVSPTVKVTPVDGGFFVEINDATNLNAFTLNNGSDGKSLTHSWEGTNLILNSASGTTITDLKGPKGDGFEIYKTYASVAEMDAAADSDGVPIGKLVMIKSDVNDEDNAKVYSKTVDGYKYLVDLSGAQGIHGEQGPMGPAGPDGKPGESISISEINESNVDGGTNTVIFSDGQKLEIKNGKKGSDGVPGENGNDGADGAEGRRGPGILHVTSSTISASGTAANGIPIKYKISLSKVKSESSTDEIFAGDTVKRSVYLYPVLDVDDEYVYLGAYTSIKGSTGAKGSTGDAGADGKSAYEFAVLAGYTGSEEEFADKLAKEIPTKISELDNDKNLIDAGGAPVQSVNNKTGNVSLNYSDVGAEQSGASAAAVSAHNTNSGAHSDIRLLITGLADRLNTIANSDDTTLDQMKEVVAYIKSNRTLIESITTEKINVTDIVDDLVSFVDNKPLSAAQGVVLKELIDAISVPKKLSELENDKEFISSESDPSVPEWAKQPQKPSYSKGDVGLGNVDNIRQYSSSNPPPYPVNSVAGKTGSVTLAASDISDIVAETWDFELEDGSTVSKTVLILNNTAATTELEEGE